MAKTMTIAEKREHMERELKRLTAFETIIDKLERSMMFEYGVPRDDGNGNFVKDEYGDLIYDEPTEDNYYYDKFLALKSAVEEIKALV